jgi:8-oxo-dGTP pyrophosphatase MutT (NUDIX family)
MKEKRDLYDKNGNITEYTYFKGDKIPEGYYPMVVMIAIQNGEGKFLMQKRTINKGGDWGVTGGHPKSGETCIMGIITEVKEELGIDISKEEIKEFNSGCDGKECYKMYYLKKDLELSKLKIQESELTEVRWFSIEELETMVDMQELNIDQVAFFKKCMSYINNNYEIL